MEYEPAARVRVVIVATPCELSVATPRGVVPFLKLIVPVGADPVEVTVAVNVTGWPYPDGFALEVSTVVVVAALMVSRNIFDVLDWNEESPA